LTCLSSRRERSFARILSGKYLSEPQGHMPVRLRDVVSALHPRAQTPSRDHAQVRLRTFGRLHKKVPTLAYSKHGPAARDTLRAQCLRRAATVLSVKAGAVF
jgi:hypothetical protein